MHPLFLVEKLNTVKYSGFRSRNYAFNNVNWVYLLATLKGNLFFPL